MCGGSGALGPEALPGIGEARGRPSVARVYGALLGRKNNFAADRQLAAGSAKFSRSWWLACGRTRPSFAVLWRSWRSSAADCGSAATASTEDARHVTQMIRSGGGSHPGAVPLPQHDWSWCGCPANHLRARTLWKLSEQTGGESSQCAQPNPRTGRRTRRPQRTASCRAHEPAGPTAPAFPPSPPSVLPTTRRGNR